MIEESRPPSASGIGHHHVVLVHGTWAHGFWHSRMWPFLRPESRQREVRWPVRSRLADAGMTVHPDFTWSGRNSHRCRMEAGEQLAAFVESITSPLDRVSIVAHSHGGLVALYSLRHPGTERVQNVVCLATPFLHFSRQPLDLSTFRWFPVATGYAGFLIGMFLWLILWVTLLGSLAISNGVAAIVGVAAAAVGVFVMYRIGRRTLSNLEAADSSVSSVSDTYAPVPRKGQELLILRKVGDEASTALATGAFVEWLTTLAWKGVVGSFALARRVFSAITSLLQARPATAGALFLAVLGLLAFNEAAMMVTAYVLAGVVAAVLAACLVQLSLLLVIALLSGISFGVAKDLAATSFVRVHAEPTPVGPWPVELLSATGFAHSEIHEDPDVADRIVSWIRSHVDERREAGV